jgi:hypothetical protein
MIKKLLATLALLGSATTAQSAFGGDAALAESLFRQGRSLMDKRDFAAACPKLAESYNQDPATGTLLALALCQEGLGQTASAWANFVEVTTRAKREGRADREQAARSHAEQLEPKLSHLTIEVDPALSSVSGLVVKRNGVTLGAAAWGSPAPVDPGQYVIEASAPGRQRWQTNVTVAASGTERVQINDLAAEPARPEPLPAPKSEGSTAVKGEDGAAVVRDSAPAAGNTPLRTVGLALCGASALSLGVGGFFAIRAMNLNSDSKQAGRCADNHCDQEGLALRKDSISSANTATVAFVAGGVLAAAGVTLFIVGNQKPSNAQALRIGAAPVVGPRDAAMVLRGQF